MNLVLVPILFILLSIIEVNTPQKPVKIPKNWVKITCKECVVDGLDSLDYITTVQIDLDRLRKKPRYSYK